MISRKMSRSSLKKTCKAAAWAAALTLCFAFISAGAAQAKCPAKVAEPTAPKALAACKLDAYDPGVVAAPKGWYCGVDPKAYLELAQIVSTKNITAEQLGSFNYALAGFQNAPKQKKADPGQGKYVTLTWKNCVEAKVMDKLLKQYYAFHNTLMGFDPNFDVPPKEAPRDGRQDDPKKFGGVSIERKF